MRLLRYWKRLHLAQQTEIYFVDSFQEGQIAVLIYCMLGVSFSEFYPPKQRPHYQLPPFQICSGSAPVLDTTQFANCQISEFMLEVIVLVAIVRGDNVGLAVV